MRNVYVSNSALRSSDACENHINSARVAAQLDKVVVEPGKSWKAELRLQPH